MGFRLNRSYVLEFEGAMEGAFVKLRKTPIGVVLELRGGEDRSGVVTDRRAAGLLSEYVADWTLEDENGQELARTADAILANLEQPELTKIMVEWLKAAAGITAPLDPPGAAGTLTDADMPMQEIEAT